MSLMPIVSPVGATAYRLDNVVADGVTLDLSAGASTLTNCKAFTWRPNGTRLFAAEGSGNTGELHYWDLSTAWDISTATYVTSIDLMSIVAPIDCVQFNATGAKVIHSYGNVTLMESSLSSDYGGTATELDRDAPEGTAIGSFHFTPDGTEIYYVHAGSIKKKTLSTGFDISTWGATSTVTTAIETYFSVARDGTRLLYIDRTDDVIREYGGSAYSFSAFSLLETFDPGIAVDFAEYSGNGKKLHTVAGSTMTQYSTVG